jgi:hypothetical protein
LLFHLGRPVAPAGHQTAIHHGLPSPVQWAGRKIPPPAEGSAQSAVGRHRLATTPSLGSPRITSGSPRGLRHLGGGISLRLPSFVAWPVSFRRRAATRHIRQPVAVFSPLRIGPHRLLATGDFNISGTAHRLFRLCAVAPSVAGFDAGLPRSIPRPGPRPEILRGGCRRLPNGGLCGPPQATSREDPALAGSAPSPGPASSAARKLSLHRLSPGLGWGGGSVEAVNAGSEHWRNPPVESSKSVNGKTAFGAKYNQSQLNRRTDHWYLTNG